MIISPEAIMVIRKVVFVLGLLNAATAITLFLSCRCMPGLTKLMKRPLYKNFYKYHCYIWWIFWPSVVVHVILAFLLLGFPF